MTLWMTLSDPVIGTILLTAN